ncbi:MAG: bifunctional precorrin-2 dehydrogenase/sirohydrochlorin ferrochelatase, partial [Lachnospiraceae bacterium]|nr:bifunctional precorrin-2 dehydrogenase/sirohydrochlorin ferrochelatase [Lachnospiraceae bacterium]
MNLFPFFANISGSTFLIIGGGSVAKEKISSIRRFGEKIIVVAENTDILPE